MNKQQAQQIIRDTFESSFDKNGFTGFIKNLLNHIREAPLTYQGNYIPDAYKQYIKKLERIGKFSDGENNIDILVITLQKETSLERARTMQRNFIAWYLNGSRGGEMKDAALAAFVSPDKEDWRFSLVRMDYKFEKTKSGMSACGDAQAGKMKVKEEFTPARRWSFLVGANEKSHTAQSRLVNILVNDEQSPTLKEIENAFDIEIVTKEFFLKYRELFLRTKEELDKVVTQASSLRNEFEAKGVDTVNFAKKLLGQIIFLYFLQKKGWFGVSRDDDWGTGSKQFLRELFEKKHGDYLPAPKSNTPRQAGKNFFNDILEPLFYEALRIDRSHDDGYYSRFDCKIPFLNGGLFDPIGNYDWVHTDIIIPDKLFSNKIKTREGDTGTGILDVFDRYNFTVKEDEPLEKEVAIDPELLGKSYEKFNAIRPDNYDEFRKALKSGKKGEENKFNKKFGVYYTPREIVHYMCQQSLINYLHSVIQASSLSNNIASSLSNIVTQASSLSIPKEDIEALIHTGEQVSEIEARVISEGRETRTYSHKLPESIRKNAVLIDEKLADITVCDPAVGSGAFPVGMMSEIVRVRNVLSTFIHRQDACATTYDFKRRCIEHSLYGVDIDPGAVEIAKLRLWLSLIVDEDLPAPRQAFYVYIIRCDNNSFYIGQTEDIEKRWKEHCGNKASWTKKYKPIEIIHYEEYKTREEAVKREKDLKTGFGRKWIRREFDKGQLRQWNGNAARQAGDINNIKPLPNLDYKVVCGNSLLGVEKNLFNNELFTELEKLKPLYFNETNPTKKQEYKKQIDDLISQITNGHTEFDFEVYFSEVFHKKGGFDVVIVNPPYVRQEKIKDQKQALQKQEYEVYNSTSDLYTYFYERSYHILKPNGFSCFISSNKWMRAKYGEKLRRFFKEKTILKQIIDFTGYQVFDATVDTNILLFQKILPVRDTQTEKPSGNIVNILNIQPDFTPSTDITNYFNSHKLEMKQSDFDSNCFTFGDETTLILKKKIEQKGIPLKNWDAKIYRGIITGFNEAFIIDTQTKKQLCAEDTKSAEIIKPILRGRDIYRYGYKWAELWLIRIESRWTNQNRNKKAPEIFFKEIYPAVYKHLKTFGNTRGKGKGLYNRDDQGDYWWELRDCDYYPEFEKDKIVYSDIADRLLFAYDRQKIYTNNTVYFLNTGNKYLLAVLNSMAMDFYYRQISSQLGNAALRAFTIYVEQLPIPKISESDQKPFIYLVDKILAITKDKDYLQNPQKQAKVKAIEAEIDQLVYKLYDLTPEEIKIVEGD